MFLFMTYGQFLALTAGTFIGSLGGVALVVYLLYRAVMFLLPIVAVALIGVLIYCVARNGIKTFVLAAASFLLRIFVTLIASGLLLAGACALAYYDHVFLGILVMIPAVLVFLGGVVWAFVYFLVYLSIEGADPDKKFTTWMLAGFALYLVLTYLQEDDTIPLLPVGPFSAYDFGFLLYVLLVNICRKHNLSKSILIALIPVFGYISMMLYFSIDMKEWWYPVSEILQTCGIKAALFCIPALVTGFINKARS
ncbi:MAG: hypothetical protein MJ178_09610 [Treponemataceae bacterium]|nr:hypothetical protein [Treponemataceae bacterium]